MKTRLLALAFLLCTTFAAKAQYVTIPDPNFVNFIISRGMGSCLNGNQLDTTCALVRSRTTIECQNFNISNIEGIQYFDSVVLINCSGNNIPVINTLPPLVRTFICSNSHVTAINSLPSRLFALSCDLNQLTTLPPIPSSLRELNYEDNNISAYVSVPDSLYRLSISRNPISFIPSLPSKLANFWMMGMTNLTSFPSLPEGLLTINCSGTPTTYMPVLPNSLAHLYCTDCNLTSLPELTQALQILNCSNNPMLMCLPKLYPISIIDFSSTGISCVPNYVSVNSSTPALSSLPLCTPGNTNDCVSGANLSGRVYIDADNDCIFSNSDVSIDNLNIDLLNSSNLIQQATTNNGGFYSFDVNSFNTYQIGIAAVNLPFIISCPANGILYDTLTATDSIHLNRNFALHCKTGFDLAVQSVSTGQVFRPANYTNVDIYAGDLANFYNASCAQGVAGTVTVAISGPATYVSPAQGAVTPSNVANNVLTWNVADFGTADALHDFNIVVQTDTFAQIGQQVCFTVSVTPTTGDNDTTNNTLTHCFDIVNSYDPNDKTAYPSGDIDTAQEWLTYRIRFQNTGNAEAQHIYIMDTLESDLDGSTFQLLAYSHQPNVQINENIVRFNFPNINLPDSFSNEPGSHGYVQYKVKLKENLPIGTTIENTAFIYFDFNPPVVTNTATNTITEVQDTTIIGIKPLAKDFAINIYPNPASQQVTVTAAEAGYTIYMYTAQGKLVASQSMAGTAETLNIAELPGGIYYIEVAGKAGTARKKLVKL